MQDVLKSLAETFSKLPTREEFVQAFKAAMDVISKALTDLNQRIDTRLSQIQDGKDGKDGRDGIDGKDGKTITGPRGPQGEKGDSIEGRPGRDGSPDTGNDIIRKINGADDLIESTAIEGLEEFKKQVTDVKIEPRRGMFGRSLLQLYVDGAKKGAIQYLNLVAGTGVTLTYNRASGRNDITISASGSGSFSVLTATGTVDDSNVTFTFVSAPTLVVVNGNAYRNGQGVTISGTTATLDNAPGTGGDVYGIG